jgi:predicted dehydrogenase
MSARRPSRRDFLRDSAAVSAAGLLAGPLVAEDRPKRGPNDKINIAVVGLDGQGEFNWSNIAHENVVALCDVDENRAGKARARFPQATFHQDYRKMLEQKGIDAVVCCTPDHLHAFVTLAALALGKHVYCEKPLTHNVREARMVREAAAKVKVATQMGTQIHAEQNYRRVVELVQAGVLGPVSRVHVWCATRPAPGQRAKGETQPPAGLAYDLWIGPAPVRPYHPSHIPFRWRWWWDFGGGVLADMACHYIDLPHWALSLRAPTRVEATGRKTYQGDNDVPDLMQVDYDYPARGDAPPVKLTWYHGVTGPDLTGKVHFPGYNSGVLFEGPKGQLIADYGKHALLPAEQFQGFTPPAKTIPPSLGHHREWLEAIRTGGPTTCNFEHGGLLTEAVLLGNIAYRSGEVLHWDSATGTVSGSPKAEPLLRREYRKGWEL